VKYWLRPEVQALLKEGQIEPRLHTLVEQIHDDHVDLRHVATGEAERVEVDDVLLQLGFTADSTMLQMLGVALEGEAQAPIFNGDTMETNVPGVFVAGTATAGSQRSYKVYIETSHVHSEKIAAAIGGRPVPSLPAPRILPES
jgi:thioredoxin reductase (NADPH)